MTLITTSQVRAAARQAILKEGGTARSALRKFAEAVSKGDRFDVFLSHSISDAEIVRGTKKLLEERGFSVYVDWIDDPQLDRSNVSLETAQSLRERLRQCASLLYLATSNAPQSKWMPWELGYSDALHGKVGILPIVDQSGETTFKGQEYLALYPYVDEAGASMFINYSPGRYNKIRDWISKS